MVQSTSMHPMLEEKVHIVFNAKEYSRITEFVSKSYANRVYYFRFRSEEQEDQNPDYYEKNRQVLLDANPDVEIVPRFVNYTDFFEVIQGISQIIKSEREKSKKDHIPRHIFINLSAGSKITAIAGLEASKFWGITPYYVFSKHYDSDPAEGEPIHSGKMELRDVPVYPSIKPTSGMIRVLHEIQEAGGSGILKRVLVDKLRKQGILNVNSNNARNRSSAEYMALNHSFLKPLQEDWNAIEVSDDRRNQKIVLKPKGEEILNIFKFYPDYEG